MELNLNLLSLYKPLYALILYTRPGAVSVTLNLTNTTAC